MFRQIAAAVQNGEPTPFESRAYGIYRIPWHNPSKYKAAADLLLLTHTREQRKILYPCLTGKSYFSHNTMSWNKFLSFYSQSVCDSLKLEPCSALALADLQNDPHYHPVQRIHRRNTNLPLFCTVKLLQAICTLCQGQMRREDAVVPFF